MKSLLEKDYIILDGAMGTEIQKRGLKLGGIPEVLNITAKDMIEEIHMSYMEAGSDIVYANTFGANGYKLRNSGYTVKDIIENGVGEVRTLCVLVVLFVRHRVGIVHRQDEIAALDFEGVDNRLKQALDSLLICQLAALQLPEQLPPWGQPTHLRPFFFSRRM